MIFVTGASGTVGSEAIRQLESAKASFRAGYFSKEKAEAARARGIEVAIIDYNHPETLRAAFQGCDELFLLGPNALNQTQLEVNAVEAAKAVGVRLIVKQSVLGADEEAFILVRIHPPPGLPPGSQMRVLIGDPSKSGVPYVLRAKLPDGYTAPPHWHPSDESVTV